MEPTQLRSGKDTSLPVHVGAVQPDAYRHVPTLMAGASAGSQGKVQVWVPQRRILWWGMVGQCLWFIAALLALLRHDGSAYWRAAVYIVLGIPFGLPAINSLLHPCYISTDESGIAIATGKRSQAFYWTDLLSFEYRASTCYITLKLSEGTSQIDLSGYSRESRKQFLALLASKVGRERSLPGPRPNESG